MNTETDRLKIKISKAREQLSEETRNSIDSVPWKTFILEMRETKGYSFAQLADLEIETDLLLCGLLSPEQYPKELEARLKISKQETAELVEYMNTRIFKKIREEFVKITEKRKLITAKPEKASPEAQKTDEHFVTEDFRGALKNAGIELLQDHVELETPEQIEKREKTAPNSMPSATVVPPIKILAPTQAKKVSTEYTLNNLSKSEDKKDTKSSYEGGRDPYRIIPE